jgi:hypothetical protein
MSRSLHRLRADEGEVWRLLLFGEVVRAVDRAVVVRDVPTIRLPRSGRWESGLARVRPALDDALGSTALAVAWRWACAECGENAWPGLDLVARKATDRDVRVDAGMGLPARFDGGGEILEEAGTGTGARSWSLDLDGRQRVSVGVRGVGAVDWSGVDRTADVLAAWLDRPWTVEGCFQSR